MEQFYDITKDCCPYCESKDIFMDYQDYHFQLFSDHDPNKVQLQVEVPVLHCKSCNYSWLNYLAEDIIGKKQKDYMESIKNNE